MLDNAELFVPLHGAIRTGRHVLELPQAFGGHAPASVAGIGVLNQDDGVEVFEQRSVCGERSRNRIDSLIVHFSSPAALTTAVMTELPDAFNGVRQGGSA